jgi:hypothetical protein
MKEKKTAAFQFLHGTPKMCIVQVGKQKMKGSFIEKNTLNGNHGTVTILSIKPNIYKMQFFIKFVT